MYIDVMFYYFRWRQRSSRESSLICRIGVGVFQRFFGREVEIQLIDVSLPHLDSSIETCVSESRRGSESSKNHPFFKRFVARPSTEVYIEGLCNSLQSPSIGSPVKRPSVKRRLLDMVSDSSDDEDDGPVSTKTSWNT